MPFLKVIQSWTFGWVAVGVAVAAVLSYLIRRKVRQFKAHVTQDGRHKPRELMGWFIAFYLVGGLVLGGYVQALYNVGQGVVSRCNWGPDKLSCAYDELETVFYGFPKSKLEAYLIRADVDIPSATQRGWIYEACGYMRHAYRTLVQAGYRPHRPVRAEQACVAQGF